MDQTRAEIIANKMNEISESPLVGDDLINYIVDKVQRERPEYSRNYIINLMICITQGFLTVFSGPPGCGKTSICEIIANTLGLSDFGNVQIEDEEVHLSRFVPVSVERGWVGKEDFIGYYSPLTNSYEKKNKELFDCIEVIDWEKKHENEIKIYPYVVMLDEANLSPMEYYWAAFIRACDDIHTHYCIDLGGKNSFLIPNHLRFVATINNDHTTEMLSPRLIDRAWIISLPDGTESNNNSIERDSENDDNPESTEANNNGKAQDSDDDKPISWNRMIETFSVPDEAIELPKKYFEIKQAFRDLDIHISHRAEKSIRNYYAIATKLMNDDEGTNSKKEDIALDYAILQRVLPFIFGVGGQYEKELKDITIMIENRDLKETTEKLYRIIDRAERRTKVYQFFG